MEWFVNSRGKRIKCGVKGGGGMGVVHTLAQKNHLGDEKRRSLTADRLYASGNPQLFESTRRGSGYGGRMWRS